MTQDYKLKPEVYFKNARTQIAPLLPAAAPRVLEVGCGAGATLQWLKQSGRCREACGIELVETAAQAARQHADAVVAGDAEQLVDTVFEGRQFELILCLDVLEHMVEPWRFVEKLHRLLAPGGRVIFSIPNVRCLKVVLPLVFLGRWRYDESGILDRTHLRFFTRASAIELATTSELRVEKVLRYMPPHRSKLGAVNLLTLGLCADLIATQFLIASVRA
jgi:2-polyprenyl-3-methyl-5-hydroxy-6-metoxy-1,4-benzoquinol methylase